MQTVFHTIEPVFDDRSRVLILGTMPSPKSRAAGFYYMHPQNRFWRVLGALLGQEAPAGNAEKRAFLLRSRIALWDVLAHCSIEGASDGSIKNPAPNDLRRILSAAPVRAVFTTGQTAARLYRRWCLPGVGVEAVALPSTSPANCACSLGQLIEKYRVILDYL